jgi:amino acid transporter
MKKLFRSAKRLVVGKPLDPTDHRIFHKLSLIAFFAWVGLGADGLSSSCYGPEETYKMLLAHPSLALFVAVAVGMTVMIISASYSQIIELFPGGGGGYLVASKLLSPTFGMISGCALLVDYVLTITTSIAGGADAIFSFLPVHWISFKVAFECVGIAGMILLNLRGVKESVLPLVPVFIIFLLTHAFVFIYGFCVHAGDLPRMVSETTADMHKATSELGLVGVFLLILRAYSMGAGTYTGIEAVSNGLPILREPKVQTGKKTMLYMAVSLALVAAGLLVAYLVYQVKPEEGKTLNAVLFETMTRTWNSHLARVFVVGTLVAESVLLMVAAQAGFLDGPRVLANMALDRWMPTKFSTLSDRFVTQNGVLLMGVASMVVIVATHGSVDFLLVLYSINVFVTFSLSQLGMVRHWIEEGREKKPWLRGFFLNGLGLMLTVTILFLLTWMKFADGGWITLVVTGSLIAVSACIRRHYVNTRKLLTRLDAIVDVVNSSAGTKPDVAALEPDYKAKTAVILVNGFNGLGLHTLLNVNRVFSGVFKNFVFIHAGVLDAGNFKGAEEVAGLRARLEEDGRRYVDYMTRRGFYAEAVCSLGIEVIDEVMKVSPGVRERFPQSVFFGGQLVFPEESFGSKWLHNYVVFALQRRYYHQGLPFLIMPIRV